MCILCIYIYIHICLFYIYINTYKSFSAIGSPTPCYRLHVHAARRPKAPTNNSGNLMAGPMEGGLIVWEPGFLEKSLFVGPPYVGPCSESRQKFSTPAPDQTGARAEAAVEGPLTWVAVLGILTLYMHLCVYIDIYIYIEVYVSICKIIYINSSSSYIYICIYTHSSIRLCRYNICMYRLCVCVYIYIHMCYTPLHTYIYVSCF